MQKIDTSLSILDLEETTDRETLDLQPPPTIRVVTKEYASSLDGFQKLCVQMPLKIFNWSDWFLSQTSKWGRALKGIDQSLLLLGLPIQIISSVKSIKKIYRGISECSIAKTAKASVKTLINWAFTIEVVTDSLSILNEEKVISFLPSHIQFIAIFGVIGSIALAIFALFGIAKQIKVLRENEWGTEKSIHALILLVCKIIVLVGATISIIAFCMGPDLAVRGVSLAISSVGLLLTVGAHFYNKLVVESREKERKQSVAL